MSVQIPLFLASPSTGPAQAANAAAQTRHVSDPASHYPFHTISDVTCFVAGSLIRTPQGDVPIETVNIGDFIATRDRGAQPIRWVGTTTLRTQADTAPITIAAGAFGNKHPLRVSPHHRLLLSGWRCAMVAGTQEVFAAAKDLINGRDITRAAPDEVTYIHIAFDDHNIITTDNVSSESFHPDAMPLATLTAQARSSLVTALPTIGATPATYGPDARAQVKAYEARLIRP